MLDNNDFQTFKSVFIIELDVIILREIFLSRLSKATEVLMLLCTLKFLNNLNLSHLYKIHRFSNWSLNNCV